MTDPGAELLERLRPICLTLPEVTERLSHGAPTWFVGGKRTFVTLWADGHHHDDFPHLWCAAPPGVQAELVESDPERFFRPPYVGGRGWIGVRLDVAVDWAEITGICTDAYGTVAPARLQRALDRVVEERAAGSRAVVRATAWSIGPSTGPAADGW